MWDIDYEPYKDFSSFLQALFQKELKAWELLYEKYGPWLYHYLVKNWIDPVYAEDLVHGAFCALLVRINKGDRLGKLNFQQDYELLSYLAKICRRIIIDDWRKSVKAVGLQAVSEDHFIGLADIIASTALIDEDSEQKLRLYILRFLDRLKNDKHRKIVRMYFVDGLALQEIIVRTGEKKDNVKKILARCKGKLTEDLRKILADNQQKQEL